MRVVVAPDSFKGTMSAAGVAAALRDGWLSVRPGDEVACLPMADGGEGTLEAFGAAVPGARTIPVGVTGPVGGDVDAWWLRLPATPEAPGGIGVVELASTSGIELLHGSLSGMDAHTLGFGQAIRASLEAGVSRLVLGIGSSASTDGGAGMLTSLGARLLDAVGEPIGPGARGLGSLARLELAGLVPPPVGGVVVITDVANPLLGPTGAAAVFGPQKGLGPTDIERAEVALSHLAELLRVDANAPGAGAAGGTGAALLFWDAVLVPGAVEVARLVRLPEALAGADVVVTGEGSFDATSPGKAPSEVAALACAAGVPVWLAAGRIAPDADLTPFRGVVSLTELVGEMSAIREPRPALRAAGQRLAAAAGRR